MKIKSGFTLIEIMVSLVVFAIVMTAMTSAFYKTYKDWQRQRDYNLALENGRWAMELMSNEIRVAHADNNLTHAGEVPLGDHQLLTFHIDRAGKKGANLERIYYWLGYTPVSERYVLYRSVINKNQDLSKAILTANRQELSRFVVESTDIFNVSSGCAGSATNCTVILNLTVRPKPDQPETPGNRDFSFRTMVRPRS
jgi:prepilin-type N-terminal cleavage/methylation domain-containing protein